MEVLSLLLGVYIIFGILFFIFLFFGNTNVKITNYKTNEVIFATGFKRFGICLLFSLMWPYIVIKNVLEGE